MKKLFNRFLQVTVACMLLLASPNVLAQDNKSIDLKLNKASFKEFLQEIESKTDYKFVYDGVDTNSAPAVTANYKQTPVLDILKSEIQKANFRYEVNGYQVVLMRSNQAEAAPRTITGKITDEFGDPVVGASISVKGTTVGTMADDDGNYSLTVPANAKNPRIVFSFVGYNNKEVALLGGSNLVNMKFEDQTTELSDVVVIGYGSVKKSDATGAVEIIKSKDFNKGISSSAESLFNGHIAGVQVTPGSGQPGANTSVRIRGVNSISASSEPLYVIDGVPIENSRPAGNKGSSTADTGLSNTTLNPLSMIAASDIESMTVLKDASATAIYGSRGANGVIIIKTKGGSEGAASVSYSSSIGFSNASKKLKVLKANEYREYVPTAGKDVSTDWQDEIFRTAMVQDHNITLTSGTRTTSYRASANISTQDGVVIATGLDRYTLRFNLTHKMFDDRVIFNINANNTYYKFQNILEQETGGSEGGIINNALKADPTQPVYNPDGTFNEYANTVRNPVAIAKQLSDRTKGNRFIGSGDATVFLLPKVLSVKGNFAYDTDNLTRKVYQPRTSKMAEGVQGRGIVENNKFSNYLFESYLTLDKTFNEIHALNVVGGYSWQQFENYTSSTLGEGFVTDNLGVDNLGGANFRETVNNREINRLISFYGRVNYNLMDRYLMTVTVRHDGSSRFGPNKRWATFPSAAVAWKIKEESFMKDATFVNDLKVRLGYGVTGNQDIGNFQYSQTYAVSSIGGTYFGGKFYPSYNITGIANPDLKWEETRQLNAGLDFSLFNSRLRGSLDVYEKKTKNLLLYIDAIQPAVSGTYLDNIGEMSNKGIELTLNGSIISSNDFDWGASFNVAYNKNELTKLYNNKDIIYGSVSGAGASGNTQILRVGEPIGSFYGKKFTGIENGKETFESDERTVIGNALPDVIMGFTNNFSYKNWDMSFVLRAALGVDVYNNTRAELSQGSRLPGQNTNKEGAEFHKAGGGGIEYPSSRWVEDGSFLRLDNLTLGYNLKIAPKVIKSARVFATAQNLFVLSGYKGYDPEVSTNSGTKGVKSIGIDYCSYPHARSFVFGVNLNF